jgi:uncharacterized protein (TIGR02246 family)
MAEDVADQQAATTQAVVADVLAAEADWAEAIVANDADRIAGFVTEDWVIVSESGISPGATFLALVASGELDHTAMAVADQAQVRVLGDIAIVTARMTNTAHFRGQRYDADEWTMDVFVRRDGRWLCALTHYTPVRMPSS